MLQRITRASYVWAEDEPVRIFGSCYERRLVQEALDYISLWWPMEAQWVAEVIDCMVIAPRSCDLPGSPAYACTRDGIMWWSILPSGMPFGQRVLTMLHEADHYAYRAGDWRAIVPEPVVRRMEAEHARRLYSRLR